ncbi:MAG: glycosyltransferase family 39 protein [Terriglobales bacterium]
MATGNINASRQRTYPHFLLLLALSIRIVFLFYTHNTGTDAWARYMASLSWAQRPDHIPSDVWLPLPFWILGAVLRFWPSELAARLFTVVLGAATVLPFYGVAKRVCDPWVAFGSALVFACLGLHIGYSVSTSSEAPAVLFMISGTYCWLRFRTHFKPGWLVAAALAFDAAALCRYEIWVFIAVIGALTLFEPRLEARHSLSHRFKASVTFAFAASLSSIAWCIFSLWKWGDPLAQAHKTASMNAHRPSVLQPGFMHKLLAVPGDLTGTLGPIVLVLSLVGIVKALKDRNSSPASDLAIMALAMAGFHGFNAIANGATMARYTLMYSWLFIVLAFYALAAIGASMTFFRSRTAIWLTVITFVAWQAALVAGAQYAPCRIADKLGGVSATVPLRCELRETISWLDAHLSSTDSVIVDDLQYESTDIVRFSKVGSVKYFRVPYMADDTATLQADLSAFVQASHPRLVVYSPKGQLGRIWRLPEGEGRHSASGISFSLCQIWRNDDYRIYRVAYERQACSDLAVSTRLGVAPKRTEILKATFSFELILYATRSMGILVHNAKPSGRQYGQVDSGGPLYRQLR